MCLSDSSSNWIFQLWHIINKQTKTLINKFSGFMLGKNGFWVFQMVLDFEDVYFSYFVNLFLFKRWLRSLLVVGLCLLTGIVSNLEWLNVNSVFCLKCIFFSAATLVMHPVVVCLHMPIFLWFCTFYNREIHQLFQFFRRYVYVKKKKKRLHKFMYEKSVHLESEGWMKHRAFPH